MVTLIYLLAAHAVCDYPLQGDWLTQAVVNWLGDDGDLIETVRGVGYRVSDRPSEDGGAETP